jgi:hypothetical protein
VGKFLPVIHIYHELEGLRENEEPVWDWGGLRERSRLQDAFKYPQFEKVRSEQWICESTSQVAVMMIAGHVLPFLWSLQPPP